MGLGVVAIADPPTAIRLKVPFSDGLGGGKNITLNFRPMRLVAWCLKTIYKTMDIQAIKEFAKAIRRTAVQLAYKTNTSHTGGTMCRYKAKFYSAFRFHNAFILCKVQQQSIFYPPPGRPRTALLGVSQWADPLSRLHLSPSKGI